MSVSTNETISRVVLKKK